MLSNLLIRRKMGIVQLSTKFYSNGGDYVMNKFKKVMFSGVVIGGLLAGCSSGAEDTGNEPIKEEAKPSDQKDLKQPSEPKKDKNGNTILNEVGQTHESKAGNAELMKYKEVNETVDIAPLKVTIQDIKVIKMTDVDEEFATDLSYMADVPEGELKDGFSYIQVQFTAENTSEKNIEWYNLMNVVTDKGEQIDGQMKDFLSDDAELDSQFIGKVTKEYKDGFVIKNEDINKVKLVFGYTEDVDNDFQTITEKQTVEYDLN